MLVAFCTEGHMSASEVRRECGKDGWIPLVVLKVEGKTFDNQAMVYYKFNADYKPNIKIFKNGNIQITGVKDKDDVNKIVEDVVDGLRLVLHGIVVC